MSDNKSLGRLSTIYRGLLTREASVEALQQSLDLLDKIGVQILPHPSVEKTPEVLAREEDREALRRRAWSESLQEYMQQELHAAGAARRWKRGRIELQQAAHRAVLALRAVPRLLLQIEPSPTPGEFGLAMDVCHLVFHHAYFALYDGIPNDWGAERAALRLAFLDFSTLPELQHDQYRIRALAYELSGPPELAISNWQHAVMQCDPAEHEFMTLLQSCISSMIEHGRHRQALLFLLEVSHRIGEADTEEFQELIELTFDAFNDWGRRAG